MHTVSKCVPNVIKLFYFNETEKLCISADMELLEMLLLKLPSNETTNEFPLIISMVLDMTKDKAVTMHTYLIPRHIKPSLLNKNL